VAGRRKLDVRVLAADPRSLVGRAYGLVTSGLKVRDLGTALSKLSSSGTWLRAHGNWLVWGGMLGVLVAVVKVLTRHDVNHDVQTKLGDFGGLLVSAIAVLAACIALAVKLVTMPENQTRREWPIFIVFPVTVVASFAAMFPTLTMVFKIFGVKQP
jgi:hypothetical protein